MRHPNLVLVTVECWRADHFGCLTPKLSDLGRESVVFSDAQTSGGWTLISMTALMSSTYASMHGGVAVALSTPFRRTLAECLLENGYWTAGFTANPVCGSHSGFHRGFGMFQEAHRKQPEPRAGAPQDPKTEWQRFAEMGIPVRDTQTTVDARELTDRALHWIERRRTDEPFFLWLHYLDPHWPCQMAAAPSTREELLAGWQDYATFRNQVLPSRGKFDPGEEMRLRWARRYQECLTSTDAEIGRLLDALRMRPDWGRTIVAATGDHGEELYERGTWHHSWNQLHREGIHVPLLIRIPGTQHRCVDEPIGLLDLTPTLLDYVAVDMPATMIGKTVRPLMEGEKDAARPVFTEMMGHLGSAAYRVAIRDGEWKYIYDFEAVHESKLFHLPDDPEEKVNLRDSCPGVFRRFEQMRLAHTTLGLVGLMERRRAVNGAEEALAGNIEAKVDGFGVSENSMMREQLEALGYL